MTGVKNYPGSTTDSEDEGSESEEEELAAAPARDEPMTIMAWMCTWMLRDDYLHGGLAPLTLDVV